VGAILTRAGVLRSPAPARRALFVQAARAGTPEAVLAAVRAPGFDPSKLVWFDDGDAPSFPDVRGSARITADGANSVTVETESDGPGWLVLLDGWFPGWEARVDGAPARVRRADYAFRAVRVPAGRSVVSFDYRPSSVGVGLILALLSAGLLSLAWFATGRRSGLP
ncbi:MAG: YfhO family protein, partial [Elusimicrobia bacterium]|nr:YfhO family protein [Elusimicrobiota bacterium]